MAFSYITVKNNTATNVSLEGSRGTPRRKVPAASSINIDMEDVSGNVQLVSSLSGFVTSGTVTVTRGPSTLTAAQIEMWKYPGDMYKSDYDADDNQIVDEAEEIEYAVRTSIDDTDSPYDAEYADKVIECDSTGGAITVNLPIGADGKQFIIKDVIGQANTNNITVVANAAAPVETVEGAANIVMNVDWQSAILYFDAATADWKLVGYSPVNPAVVGLNTTHRTGDGSDHADVATNTGRTDDWLNGEFPVRTTADHTAPYVPAAENVLIGCDSTGGAVAVNLAALATYANNKMLIIKDEGGNAAVMNITITPDAAEEIDGVNAPVVINVAYGVLRLYKIAGGWFTW